jgi:hypothetical protein
VGAGVELDLPRPKISRRHCAFAVEPPMLAIAEASKTVWIDFFIANIRDSIQITKNQVSTKDDRKGSLLFDAIFVVCVNGRLELLNRNQKNQEKRVPEVRDLRVVWAPHKAYFLKAKAIPRRCF